MWLSESVVKCDCGRVRVCLSRVRVCLSQVRVCSSQVRLFESSASVLKVRLQVDNL